jgi:predicted permease
MMFLIKLKRLFPSYRRAEEQDMREELESLRFMTDSTSELGNLTLAAENARQEWTWVWLEQLVQDLSYALRSMVHNKTFAALAVVSLALGIGANTAIYSFMDSILLRSLPVPDPKSLVVMKWTAKTYTLATEGISWSTEGSTHDPVTGTVSTSFPYPALKLFQDNTDVLASAFCYFGNALTASVGDSSEAVRGQYVSGNYFQGMGIPPVAGRLIQDDDDQVANAAVAVVSHGFAQRHFPSVAAAVGQTVRLNDKPFMVLGVVPAGFFGAEPGYVPDLYLPMHADLILQAGYQPKNHYLEKNYYWIEIMARLKPGVSVAQAQAVLAPQFHRFVESTATTDKQLQDLPQLKVVEGGSGLDSLRRRYSRPIYFLLAMVGSILLIACANIANLLLARAAARRREIAVRLSIGASRLRVIRQLLTESVLLSTLGGVLGLMVAWWGIRLMTVLLANGRENFTLHAELNATVLAVTFGLSLLTGLLFGFPPALQATRVDIAPALKEVHPGELRRWRRTGLSHVLVVSQIALSLILLVAAGLFGRTLAKLHSIDLGFNRENLLLFSMRPGAVGYSGTPLFQFYENVRQRVASVPGVRSVTLSGAPLPMGGGTGTLITIAGVPTPAPTGNGGMRPDHAIIVSVGPDFFTTMQIPLFAGREFTARDVAGTPRVGIVNRTLAKAFGLDNPVGRVMTVAGNQVEIIAVAQEALTLRLKEEPMGVIYLPFAQGTRAPSGMSYEVRVAGDPLTYASSVRQIVRAVDSRVAVFDVKTQAGHIDQAISSEITLARLCTAFAALALVIACVGLYGTVAFNVARRTSEIGIRMTLGARAPRIVWMVLREVLMTAALGLAIGLPIVWASTDYVKPFLYEIEPHDSAAIAISVAMLLVSAIIAGFVPARRASRIDPIAAVRHD